jgi:16S rRNA C1402 N4-methylase RsmH
MIAWTLRAMRRGDEALEMQLALERDHAAAGTPDAYVFEELEILYRERGDAERARRYADKLAALRQETPK